MFAAFGKHRFGRTDIPHRLGRAQTWWPLLEGLPENTRRVGVRPSLAFIAPKTGLPSAAKLPDDSNRPTQHATPGFGMGAATMMDRYQTVVLSGLIIGIAFLLGAIVARGIEATGGNITADTSAISLRVSVQ